MNIASPLSNGPHWLAAAAQAAGHQHWPAGALYVVATPIGNLADISLRALHALALADAVACEDTRVSAVLLQRLGLDKPLLAVHEHNERQAAERVLQRLAAGERVAYLSDAGTPAISDPGAVLVALARAAGHAVVPLPGASAVVTALSAAGVVPPGDGPPGFAFHGFLASKGAERRAALAALAADTRTQVLFEAPHRIAALLGELAAACGARTLTLCRELTKQFEQIATLRADQAPAWLAADEARRKGEFVLVLHARAADAAEDDGRLPPEAEQGLAALLQALPLRQAVDLTAQMCRLPRKAIYQRALALRGADDDTA